jgi:hypothetical protein
LWCARGYVGAPFKRAEELSGTQMPSPEASRRNLAAYYSRVPRLRSQDESILIWRLTLKWWTRDERRPPKQREWAAQLGVTQQYVSKMARRFKREWLELARRWNGWQTVTLDDLRRARERRQRARVQVAQDRAYDAEQRRKRWAAGRSSREHPYSFASTGGHRAPDDESEDD